RHTRLVSDWSSDVCSSDLADDGADENALAMDVIALADALGIDRFAVLGWSSGGPDALALAAGHTERVAVAGVAAGLVPREDLREIGRASCRGGGGEAGVGE